VSSFIDHIDIRFWQEGVAPLVGVTSACVALFMGQAWLRSRRRGVAEGHPPEEKEGQTAPDPFMFGSATEKRYALRRTGRPIKILIAQGDEKEQQYEGWVVDRSVGGLCLSVAAPVAENTILSVRALNAPEQIPWVKLEVKRCQATRDNYELGCQFVNTPTWNVLLLFG
jgi:hypothetical protein